MPVTEAAPFYLWKEARGTECRATSEVCVELQVGTMGKVVQLPRLGKNVLTFFLYTPKKSQNVAHIATKDAGAPWEHSGFTCCLRVIGCSHVAGAQVKLVAVQTELNNPT